MQILRPTAVLTAVLFCGSIAPIVSPTAAQTENGLLLELRRQRPEVEVPIIVGEDVNNLVVALSIINNSEKTQRILKLDKYQTGRLGVRIIQSDGSSLAPLPGAPPPPPPLGDYLDLEPGQKHNATLILSHFGYSGFWQAGEHVLEITLTSRNRAPVKVKQTLKFTVLDVSEEDILRSVPIPEERDSPEVAYFIQKLRVVGKYYLYYRRFVNGQPGDTAKFAEVDKQTDFVVSGVVGSGQPIYVAYPHSVSGITLLTLNSGGTIDRKITTDDKTDAAPAKPE